MKRSIALVLPVLALAACGEAGQEIPVTNTDNVIPNDELANYSFENDEVVNTIANDMADLNAMEANGVDVENEVEMTEPQTVVNEL